MNLSAWDSMVPEHFKSDFYDVPGFLKTGNHLNELELKLLGNIQGNKVAHLQCHFGMDTISLETLGARVTGLDFSSEAIETARSLAENMQSKAKFICANVLQAAQYMDRDFDLVFTTYGVLCWLDNLEQWAEQVHAILGPSGRLILVEFHPFIDMLSQDYTELAYSYFNRGPLIFDFDKSYASSTDSIKGQYTVWNHPLSDVFSALNKFDFELKYFKEFDFSPYPCFPGMIPCDGGYEFEKFKGQLPLIYAMVADKRH